MDRTTKDKWGRCAADWGRQRQTRGKELNSHRGEALNEREDTLAEDGREKPEEKKKLNQHNDQIPFEVKQENV